MSNLREMVALACVSSNLAMVEWAERAADHVAALGAAGLLQSLGCDVFRWAYANDPYAADRVRAQLEATVRRRYRLSESQAAHVAAHGMWEFQHGECVMCTGRRGVTLVTGEYIECPDCEGSGLRVWSNRERVAGCGLGWHQRAQYGREIEPALLAVLAVLRDADAALNAGLNAQLERRR